MADVASQTVGAVVQSLMGYIIKQVGYLTSSAKHVRHMENRMKHLEGTRSDVKSRMDANDINNKVIPTRVPGWLQEVEEINEDVKSISSTAPTGCFNIKGRYQAATKALEATVTIERLIKENSETIWTDKQKPYGRVYSELGSTSTPSRGDTKSGSKSRDRTFNVALKHLQQDDKTRVIALCGMGGVGKTTMMNHLKTVAWDNKMFKYIVTVVVGGNFDLKSIQHALAVQTGDDITESDESLRAECLHKRFKKLAEDKQKCLVILDDVWNTIELTDIGLNPLPNGFKLLLTSRNARICRQITSDVEVVQVEVLEEIEACDLFFQITGVSEHNDHELYKIGGKIVKKCGGLPLAIKVIAATLKSQEKYVWENTYRCLKNNKPGGEVQKCIEISYTNIKEAEEKAVFLLCGMFPEDSNIPIEELTRYAWGLKLLEDVSTMEDARNMTKTCVKNLIDANLLMVGDSDHNDYVKMHDIVLAFVVDSVSKGEDAWIIDHRDMSKWNDIKMSKSCKQISLSCKGGCRFPPDFKFPHLYVLKLMQGEESLLFPEDFYGEMENLKVIAYDNMEYPLLPTFRCSTNLQTLCLHNCLLTFDISCIGDLSSLEVLSFANSYIKKLPSTFKNLKKLRVLDLTCCDNCHVIDDDVLKSLDTLEELYMTVAYRHVNAIRFTEKNCNELAVLSKKLSALDIEILENKAQLLNMSFENLKRFRISVGCLLKNNIRSYENTLMLVTNRGEILDSRLNELFKKTEVLLLTVAGMNNLADLEIKSPDLSPQYSSFHNLRDLVIEDCEELGYLFTLNIATSLSKLESLKISKCLIMEKIVHIESNEARTITFPKLKSITLGDLPMLSCLCNTVNAIDLPKLVDLKLIKLPNFTSIYPKKLATSSMSGNISAMQTLLTDQVAIPKLERLSISDMENLKEIWPCENSSSEQVMLREIEVEKCNSLVNLFPDNPMSLLQRLEEIEVKTCSSIEVLFNIDMDRDREIVECNSRLRSIKAYDLGQLSEIWRLKGGNNSHIIISSFQAVETIHVERCNRFRNLFTPTTSNFDMRALTNLEIEYCGESREDNSSNEEQEINVISNEEIHEVHDSCFNFSFPPNLIHNVNHLRFNNFNEVEVVFEINSPSSRELETAHQQPLQQQPVSSFHNLTAINVEGCHNIKYLFSPLMDKCNALSSVIPSYAVGQMQKLEKLKIMNCESLKEIFGSQGIVSNNSGGSSTHVDEPMLENINVPQLSHLRKIEISNCELLEYVFTFSSLHSLTQLQKLKIKKCKAMKEIVKQEINGEQTSDVVVFPCLKSVELIDLPILLGFFLGKNDFDWKSLEEVVMMECPQVKVFTSGHSTAPNLNFIHSSLGKHQITECGLNFHEIPSASQGIPWSYQNLVEIDLFFDEDVKKIIPSNELLQVKMLERIQVHYFSKVEEIFEVALEGTNNTPVQIPNLTQVVLGYLPELKYIWKNNRGMVLEFPNLTTLDILACDSLKHVFTSSMVGSLLQLQGLQISVCENIEVIVKKEEEEEECDGKGKPIELPRLKYLTLFRLPSLKGFCLGKEAFSFPSLDSLKIIDCPKLTLFTNGHSTTPKLKRTIIADDVYDGKGDLNAFINTKLQEGLKF